MVFEIRDQAGVIEAANKASVAQRMKRRDETSKEVGTSSPSGRRPGRFGMASGGGSGYRERRSEDKRHRSLTTECLISAICDPDPRMETQSFRGDGFIVSRR